MANTLPLTKPSTTPASITTDNFFARPLSFDAGINTSNAWVAEREASQSLSDDDDEEGSTSSEVGRAARALYDFEGKVEFRELTVKAGQELEIIKEELDDGWSLARADGQVGLIPRAYFTFVSEMRTPNTHEREGSSDTLTPKIAPLKPHKTGEWFFFPSFRQSLLGGKSLNRFSSFVATGAEDWILKGQSADLPPSGSDRRIFNRTEESVYDDDGEPKVDDNLNRHFIMTGPAWKAKLPIFSVMVHSPSKRTSTITGSYTVYLVTSVFPPEDCHDDMEDPPSPTRITVHRRFSHFVFLHTALTRRLPGIALPPLPEKQYAGRFNDEFIEARRGDLDRYLSRVIRHPVARYTEVLTFFLSCESDIEWNRRLPKYLNAPPAGANFYAQVYHPAFNVDADEAEETMERFKRHTKAVGKGVQSLRGIYERVRNARLEMSTAHRLLSYGLLSLITSTPIAGRTPAPGLREEEEEEETNLSTKGLLNNEGAWCWKDDCGECLKLTKGVQKVADTLQIVADLHDDNARRRQLATHDILKDVAHPAALYNSIFDTQRATLTRYFNAMHCDPPDHEVAGRCETVLNATMAEFETYHQQKIEDFKRMAIEHLDGDIEFYEQVLSRLRVARATFEEPLYNAFAGSRRQPSIYERELPTPRLTPESLPQPCPHVFDSAPMRSVSTAIGGVNLFLGGRATSVTSRISVLGKLW